MGFGVAPDLSDQRNAATADQALDDAFEHEFQRTFLAYSVSDGLQNLRLHWRHRKILRRTRNEIPLRRHGRNEIPLRRVRVQCGGTLPAPSGQDGNFEPVGSDRTRHANVRIIAATNHDLNSLIREGRFRADLYYRLSVFPLDVPPLRETP